MLNLALKSSFKKNVIKALKKNIQQSFTVGHVLNTNPYVHSVVLAIVHLIGMFHVLCEI